MAPTEPSNAVWFCKEKVPRCHLMQFGFAKEIIQDAIKCSLVLQRKYSGETIQSIRKFFPIEKAPEEPNVGSQKIG